MKILHLADLHIGIKLYEYSLSEEQKFFLDEVISLIERENITVCILAGDIYDKGTPPVEAVKMFDEFLVKLHSHNVTTLIISGNHDSAARLSFGEKIFTSGGIHISPSFDGNIKKVTVENINFYLLPFIRPSHVKRFYEGEINSYDSAVKTVLSGLDIDKEKVNILISHQFVAGGKECESDDINVGGIENVKTDSFDSFDYVALGHLHNPQSVGRETIRYSGSPLKYSLSEENVKKSVTVVDVKKKGDITITEHFLPMLRDIKSLEGSYDELMSREFYKDLNTDDYYYMILTDRERIFEGMKKLRTVYPNILALRYKNAFSEQAEYTEEYVNTKGISPLEIVKGFFQSQNGYEMSISQEEIITNEINDIWGGKYETD